MTTIEERIALILGESSPKQMGGGDKYSSDAQAMQEALEELYQRNGNSLLGNKRQFGKQYTPRNRTKPQAVSSGDDDNGGGGKNNDDRTGGDGDSQPTISDWLGDVSDLFPPSSVELLQTELMNRVGLGQILNADPEFVNTVEPSVELAVALIHMKDNLNSDARHSARIIIERMVQDVNEKLKHKMLEALQGAIQRSRFNKRPKKISEVAWNRTIRANLKHYQADLRTIIAETMIGYGKLSQSAKRIYLLVDQSGSMGESIIYSSIYAAVMAGVNAIKTDYVVFDTNVVDMTDTLQQSVTDVLFGVQLGGGTDIAKALTYANQHIDRPSDTTMVLISDLEEGGSQQKMFEQVEEMLSRGIKVIVLLALSNSGTPYYSARHAQHIASMGVPVFSCTPDLFPEMIAVALNDGDVRHVAYQHNATIIT